MGDDRLREWVREASAEPPGPEFWKELTLVLRAGAENDAQPNAGSLMPHGMAQSSATLSALIRLFLEQTFFQRRAELLTPLIRLSAACQDLARGNVSPMFRPTRRQPGRPKIGSNEAIMRGLAARTVTELHEGGMPVPEAASLVARALRHAPGNRSKRITPETVINWRERAMEGGRSGDPSDAMIFAFNRPLDAEFGNTPQERAKRLLADLEDNAKGFF